MKKQTQWKELSLYKWILGVCQAPLSPVGPSRSHLGLAGTLGVSLFGSDVVSCVSPSWTGGRLLELSFRVPLRWLLQSDLCPSLGFSAQHLRWMITFSPYCMESWRRSFENWIAGCLSNQPEFGFPYLCVFVLSHVRLFCNPIDYSLLCPSVHGIFQARILEWFSISSSRESFQHRDRTYVFFIAGRFFTTAPPRKTLPYVQRADNYPTLCLL